MNLLDIPDKFVLSKSDGKITYDFDFTVFTSKDKVRFQIDDLMTSWLDSDDRFIGRIKFGCLNKCFIKEHIRKEIEMKNVLDEALGYLESESYPKAIGCLDDVIYYDENHGEALFLKSRALFGQKHFVKALRHYKKAIKAENSLNDIEYHKLLLEKSNAERDNFPKIKLNIYAGDEFFSKCEYGDALKSYERALANPSTFKSKILFKLLNKKATALVKLERYDEALDCFRQSLSVKSSDYARFGCGLCEYNLGVELDDSFFGDLDISKRLKLRRALILKDVKMHEESLRCIDDLLGCHFIVDGMYFTALTTKVSLLKVLNMDASGCERILSYISKYFSLKD